jgi:ABC-type transport system substrate-binding protein
MTVKGPMLGRRQVAGLAAGALVAGSLRSVQAADASTFVSGFGLPMNLDPHQVYDVPMQSMMLNAYDNLYRYQNDPPQIVPWLAESHTVSDDGLLWEFKLRPNIKFHDGSPMTAEDVVYSFRRVLALALAPAGAFLKILKPDNVTAPDPLTVRFKLETSYAPFFAAIPSISIVNPRVIEPNVKNGDWGKAWLASNGAGSGSYRIVPAGYRPLEYLDMEINEGHFLGWSHNPKPVKKIAYRPTRETSTRVLALLNGSLDCTDSNLPADQVAQINASKIAYVQKDMVMRTFVIRMNNTKPPFNNLNARLCFAHAFNYMGFINDILGGYATRDPYPMPDNLWGIPKDVKGYDYDLKKAREYYAKAVAEGAPMKRPLELHVQVGERAERAGRPALPGRPGADRHQPESGWQHLVEPDHRRRQARHHARHVGPLGQHLLRRPRELGRPDVRQPVPRHLEGLVLLQERPGRRSASQGARDREAGRAGAALRGGDPQDHGRFARHLDLQLHAAAGAEQARQGPPLLHRGPGRRDTLDHAR